MRETQCAGDFAGFGPAGFMAVRRPPTTIVDLPADRRSAWLLVRARCRAIPGVYGMIDSEGELIYVGKSRALVRRLASYFRAPADEKSARILARAARLAWEPVCHEFAALFRELELIRRFRPRYNLRGQPGRRSIAWLYVSSMPSGRACLAHRPPVDALRVYGPMLSTARIREAVRLVNSQYQLCDCPSRIKLHWPEQLELLPMNREPKCARFDLGQCLAPCAGLCSTSKYHHQLAGLIAFLEGRDCTLLAGLFERMRRAAADHKYELAAALRDQWQALAGLADELERLRDSRRQASYIYNAIDVHGPSRWCLMLQGRLRRILPAPEGTVTADRCRRWLESVYADRHANGDIEDVEGARLAARWFKTHPDESRRVISPSQAWQICEAAG